MSAEQSKSTGPEKYDKEPGLQEVPMPEPTERKFPPGIEQWPNTSELGEDEPLPGEPSKDKRPPAIH